MNSTREARAQPRPWFRFAGVAAIVGVIATVVADFAAITLGRPASFLATPISRTAIGENALIVDGAIYLFGFGIAAVALALHRWRLDSGRYAFGVVCLAATVPVIILVAAWNGYEPNNVPDFGFHMILVYVLSALFPLAALALARGLGKVRPFWGVFSVTLAILWMLSGPVYALTPDSLEGLFERVAFLVMLVWVAGVGVLLLRSNTEADAELVDSRAAGT